MAKQDEEQDRTILGERWAQAVADLDEAREALEHATKKEREAWDALKRSRSLTVSSEDE
jgi:hypothetical protein